MNCTLVIYVFMETFFFSFLLAWFLLERIEWTLFPQRERERERGGRDSLILFDGISPLPPTPSFWLWSRFIHVSFSRPTGTIDASFPFRPWIRNCPTRQLIYVIGECRCKTIFFDLGAGAEAGAGVKRGKEPTASIDSRISFTGFFALWALRIRPRSKRERVSLRYPPLSKSELAILLTLPRETNSVEKETKKKKCIENRIEKIFFTVCFEIFDPIGWNKTEQFSSPKNIYSS